MIHSLTVAVADENGTVLDTFEANFEAADNLRRPDVAREAIKRVAEDIRFGVA